MDPVVGQVVPDNITVADGIVTIEVGDVPAGEAARIELVVRPLQSGPVQLTAEANCAEVQQPAVTAQTVEATDTYGQIVTTMTPAGFCGAAAALPMLALLFLAARMTSDGKKSEVRREKEETDS
jgi:hypothetical protein